MKVFVFILTIFTGILANAQQLSHMSQWASHQYAINPAHTGIKRCMEVQGTIRGQWIKMDGAPYTGWLSVSAPLRAKKNKLLAGRHGLGGMVIHDQIGPFKQTNLQISYAGHFNFSVENRLSLGLAFGASQLAFDLNQAKPLDPDPVINGSAATILPTASFGAWWNGANYYVGMSLYDLIPVSWAEIGDQAKTSVHGMINAGFRRIINPEWTVLPGIYVGFTKAAPLDLQLQALFNHKNKFTLGLGYRSTDALIAFLGVDFNSQWRMMYSYDFVLSKLRPGTIHSHELTISFSPCRIVSSDQQICPLFQ